MAVVFTPAQQLTKYDLNIFIRDQENNLFDPYSISYYIEDESGNNFLGTLNNTPVKEAVGYYWANILIPDGAFGTYIIKWQIKDYPHSNAQLIEQKFAVVKNQTVTFTPTVGGVVYTPGQSLNAGDLFLCTRNHLGNFCDPYLIHYEIYQRVAGLDVLISPSMQLPIKASVGTYYANYYIPANAMPGDYYIRWRFKETPHSIENSAVQEFAVVNGSTIIESPYTTTAQTLIRKLRFLLRDNNPDRNYHFMPPASEEVVQGFTQKFGYVWEDEELYEYIDVSISDLNNNPPHEAWTIDTLDTRLNSMVLNLAGAFALRALSINWVHQEFDGSVSGISLSLEKSSKYLSIKENFEAAYTRQLAEHKEFGVRFIKGVRQPRYTMGVTSALGPYSKVGVQSRRNYISTDRPMFF